MTTPMVRKAFVMASGKGSRFGKKPSAPPKTLSTVGGVSLLERNIRLIDQALRPEIVHLVAGGAPEIVKQAVRSFSSIRAKMIVSEAAPKEMQAGLLGGFAAIAEYVQPDEVFIAALGDEFYEGADHKTFAQALAEHNDFSALCAFKPCRNQEDCQRNFSLVYDESTRRVSSIREKDDSGQGRFFGLGLAAAKGELAHLCRDYCGRGAKASPYELINALPGPILGCRFTGDYVNVNTTEDLWIARDLFWRKGKGLPDVDVVIPALNEEECIEQVVLDFKRVCKQVIVMDNMSEDLTAEKARKAGACVVTRSMGGYGDAIKQGLELCTAQAVAVAEADGSFKSSDLEKLLPYLASHDAVFGSRTSERLVQPGAFMPYLVRMANRTVGLFLSLLWPWHPAKFTDVGCSLRVMRQDAFLDIQSSLIGQGPEFAPEVALELMDHGLRIAEVPISYHPRLGGGSKLSGNYKNSARTAFRMLRLILTKRITK
ncbi:Glycosyltransferase involved in cell wall bisynthesis [Desulfatibacillum alkenivorans DSM 16219]|uniref:Glycosyltransferase involved in cell wall bisynthesis n=1 Tax=Desulfatibacillum alkenivorans DSM 16219 TaxID=1121393 RepID=A0A1M6CJE8_9BACT|nr:glycosyltransferase [Desulfatibacillum alkenivorans]SHI60991.1 Glycosyltransferase involved in cell wall bisynthesis [Desulfatibacillum alkenivorans DSM 16219]